MQESRPVLVIKNAGYGETSTPDNAKFKIGDAASARHNEGHWEDCAIIAVVPPRYPPEWALHDALKQPRPLMVSQNKKRSITYCVRRENQPEHHYDWVSEKSLKQRAVAA